MHRRAVRASLIALAVLAVALAGAFWFLTGGSAGRSPSPWLSARPVAHKGQWGPGSLRPENSLAAFGQAADNGHPIELDVQLSSDGRVVVFHDHELERMTGQDGRLADKTLAELRESRLLGGTETIPALSEALDLIDARVPVFVEIKNEGEVGELEDAVAAELAGYAGPVAVMSFNPYSLARMAETAPQYPRGQLSSAFEGEDLAWYEVFLLRNLMMNWSSRPDFIAYDLAELPDAGTGLQKLRGRPLLGWTAETPEQRLSAEEYCGAVICDPGALP